MLKGEGIGTRGRPEPLTDGAGCNHGCNPGMPGEIAKSWLQCPGRDSNPDGVAPKRF